MRLSLKALLLFVALLGLGACSGGGDDAKKAAASSASLDSSRDAVLDAQEEADDEKAEKFAAKTYKKAVERLAAADEMRADEEADPKAVKNLYSKAKRDFGKAATAAKKAKKAFDKYEKAKKKFDKAVAKQDEAKLPYKTIDPDGWNEVEERLAEAKEYVEEEDLTNAKRRYDKAYSAFNDCVRHTERRLGHKKKAEEARARMTAAMKEAEGVQAAELAKDSMVYAASEAKLGMEKFTAGDFNMAEAHFASATSTYAEAKNSAIFAAEMKKNPPAETNETASLNGNPRETYREAPTREKPEAGDEGGDDEGGFSDDMTILLTHLHGDPDLEDGMLTLTYGSGSGLELKKDLNVASAKSSKHLLFHGSSGVGNSNYAVAGNTGGMILFEPIFKDRVRIEVDFQAQLNMANSPSFEVIINARDSKNYISTWYGADIRVTSGGNPQVASPPSNREWTKHPNNWLDRKENQTLILQYDRPEDQKKGLVSVYHAGQEPCGRLPTKRSKGRVGLRWYNAKWYITEIRITGKVDEEWMAEFCDKYRDQMVDGGDEEDDEWKPEKKEPKGGDDEEDDGFDF
ncbi:MAG: hypothetical protein AAF581_03645 [Planctomycetota bacterium]